MDKLKTRILLISVLLLLLFSVQSVAAVSDDDGNLTSESIDLSICDNTDDVSSDESSNNQGDVLSASNELDVLSADEVSYSELDSEISVGGNIELLHDYYRCYGGESTISISGNNRVIDGRGAVIDMAGSTIRAFNVYGSGITIKNLTIKNANYAGDGGAIYFSSSGTVENCNFINNKATGDYSYGGAIWFNSEGTVKNCNFIGNNATYYGGAVGFWDTGEVRNCNFTGNNATYYAGAIYFHTTSGTTHEVRNCNFTNNTASYDGGAIWMYSGSVENCNFTNTATNGDGGAIWMYSGSVENCNFTNNTASYDGGAIWISHGSVENCNFTGNNATTGSAIYFHSTSATKTVSNSRFLNNRANAEALEVTKNDNNITITFTGNDNLLNAIYSRNDAEVTFTDVTYWSANGIANTGSSAIKPSRSNKEAGQNITVSIVVNGELVLSGVYLTDENGMIVLDIIAGENYYITARHNTDSYYTEAERTISNMTYVNVTSQTTNNKTVNITAKSNILNEVMPGKLLFIVPNSDPINATYAGNGTWWAVHTFDDYGVYEVNASYTGLDNVTVNNGTVTINDVRLSVVKSADATEVVYNSTVQFTINVTNYGSTDATSVEVSDWLPEGLTFIEAGVINSEGQYEVFDSLDLLILIGAEEFVTFFEFSSSDIIEDGGVERDIAQWSITRIASGNSVILLITARANGLVMGNITNEVTVWYHENETDSIVNSTNITVVPANSSVSSEDVEVTYGDTIEVIATSENATGVSYKVIGKDGVVKEGTVNVGENITGLDLAAGDYTVNLTTMVNGNYTSSNYTSRITVKPANSTVKAEDVEVTYGDSIVVVVTSENATGVSYMVIGKDGVVKEGTVNVGENITGLDLAAGDYTVNLTTMVNGNYTSSKYTSKITVKPANSTVKAEDVEVTYGDAIEVIVTSENATGVSYKVIGKDGVVKEGTVNVGENITGLDLAAGDYTVNLTTMVNGNYTSSNYTSRITVKPANSTVKAEDVEVTYGDAIEVIVTSENATGVSYKVIGKDGIVKEGTINIGENITGLDLAAGDYTVNLTTMVNGNYTSSKYTSKITVKPANSTVKAEDVEVTYGKSIEVVITSENATGVSYKVIGKDGIVKEGTINIGENITGLDLAAGDYTVNLTTMVNANYTVNSYTSRITVKPANSTVKAEDVEVVYGKAIVVVVTSENATGVSYKVIGKDGVVKEGTVNVGENITGLDLAAGEYTVNLTTVVNSNYTAANYTSKITVKPAGSSVSAEDAVASFGDTVSIPVSSVNATEISYRIIDANDKAVANGTVTSGNPISVSDLAAGDYAVSLTTVVDENHTSVSNSSKLHIKHVVSIVIAPVTGYAGETVSFTVQFKYENGDSVSEGTAGLTIRYEDKQLLAASRYSILSADESTSVSDGKATFNVKLGNPGIYPYVISYSGSDVDNVQAESTLTVLKVNTAVSGIDVSGKPSDKKEVAVTVLDQDKNPVANGTVTLTLNGKTYNSTVENGKAVLSIELPNPGSYNATVTYNDNDYYNSSSSSIAVDVEKVNTNAPSTDDVSGKAGEKTDISVKFVDEKGNPVKNGTATLTIDGKTYTAEVTNGVATFKDVVLPDNGTVADVYYHGNDYYNASSATFSIKVKHDNNNTEPDSNNTDENRTVKHVSSKVVDSNATGNPIAMMLLALFVMVITYRKK